MLYNFIDRKKREFYLSLKDNLILFSFKKRYGTIRQPKRKGYKMATKKEMWENVQGLLKDNKIKSNSNLFKELEDLLAPKSRTVSNEFPPIYNDNGEVIEIYCAWFKEYRNAEDFNKSVKSKTGYHYECKDAEKEWHKYGKRIKELKAELAMEMDAVFDGIKTADEVKAIRADILAETRLLESDRKAKVNFDLHKPIY